jgi:hypothetical protein
LQVHAHLEPGQSLVVQETFDPAWEAWSAGKRLEVRPDAMGFMAIDWPGSASSGERDIRLVFATPWENRAGRVVTIFTTLIVLGLLLQGVLARHGHP